MSNPFVQISTLTSYTGALLNRDQEGMSKRLDFGGAERTRISSQFAKRKLRLAEGAHSIKDALAPEAGVGISMRSRYTVSHEIAAPLFERFPKDHVVAAALGIMDGIYPPSDKAKKKRKELQAKIDKGDADLTELLHRDELIILGRPEIDYLKNLVEQIVDGKSDVKAVEKAVAERIRNKEFKGNLKELGKRAPSLDVAMFGRMVTGDVFSAMDAAVHVAHGFAVHRQESNLDFFTAVDDLVSKTGEGADDAQAGGTAHMSDTEVTSPLLYGYYVVDVGQLRENLQGLENKDHVIAKLVEYLIHLTCTSIVGAKKGSTAPYSSADFVLVEVGSDPCRSLAGAFRRPVRGTLEDAVEALGRYVAGKDAMYETTGSRWYSSAVEVTGIKAERLSVSAVAKAAAEAVGGA